MGGGSVGASSSSVGLDVCSIAEDGSVAADFLEDLSSSDFAALTTETTTTTMPCPNCWGVPDGGLEERGMGWGGGGGRIEGGRETVVE